MAKHDLGHDVRVEREVPVGAPSAYELARDLVARYEQLGFGVEFSQEDPPRSLVGEIRNRQGSRILCHVEVEPRPQSSGLLVTLQGRVVLSGMQGMLASTSMVRGIAKSKLEELLDETIARVEPEDFSAPEPDPAVAREPEPARVEQPEPVERPGPERVELPEPIVVPKPVAGPKRVAAQADPRTEPEQVEEEPVAPPEGPLEVGLATIQTLFTRGLISADDYSAKKDELLRRYF